MKELHNHIFSNTTCISKETMLRYINKQLSKKELYEVEKHMLDCELCTDAFEGMKMATNSSILFAIDNKIDLRTGTGVKKSPIFRNLMVAASIAVIAFGAFFTVKNFNNKLDKNKLAVTEAVSLEEQQAAPENFINNKTVAEETYNEELATGGIADDEREQNNNLQQAEIATVSVEKVVVKIDEVEESVMVKDEMQMLYEEVEDEEMELESEDVPEPVVSSANERMGNDNDVTGSRSATVSRNESFSSGVEVVVEPAQKKASLKNKKKYKANKSRKYAESMPSADMNNENEAYKSNNTYDIYTYKVYDYAPAYQNEYEHEQTMKQEVVSSDFETKSDKVSAQKELANNTIEISYKQTLREAIKALKNEKYQSAITQFDIILKAHPKDINALFYSGIARYNLNQFKQAKTKLDKVLINKQTTFNQEAKWYLAKSNIALNETKKAKKILQEIITENGFYKNQAVKLLEELK